jgi:hypothetical protein
VPDNSWLWVAWGVTIVNAIELLHFKISRGEAIAAAHGVLRRGWGQDLDGENGHQLFSRNN